MVGSGATRQARGPREEGQGRAPRRAGRRAQNTARKSAEGRLRETQAEAGLWGAGRATGRPLFPGALAAPGRHENP